MSLFRVVPTLYLTSAEALALTAEDERMLSELGSPAMVKQLRACAATPGRRILVDFEAKTAVVEESSTPAPRMSASRVTVN